MNFGEGQMVDVGVRGAVDLGPIIAAIIGVGGVLLGAAISEIVRRLSRAEQYSSIVFEKRLMAYEGLMRVVNDTNDAARFLWDDTLGLTSDQIREEISAAIMTVIRYCEENSFFLEDDVTINAMTLYMGLDDAVDASSDLRKEVQKKYNDDRTNVMHVIREAAGINKFNRIFQKSHRPNINTEISRYFRERKEKYRKEEQSRLPLD